MSLKINNLDKTNEYVLIQALEDVNIGDYALIDRIFDSEGTPSKKLHHFFHFPKQQVKKGEYIAVHTKKVTVGLGTMKDGKTPVYRFHWGLESFIWNDTGDTATIIKFSVVDSMTV